MKKTIYQVLLLFVFSFNSSSVQAATFAHVREDVDTTIVYDEGREVIYLDAKRLRRGGRARKIIVPINAGYLVLLDGQECTDLTQIRPDDVVSVNVLRGDRTALFGEKAEKGVILISQKRETPERLVLVNGKECANLSLISPSQIENVTVLKGDQAAKYGEKGKNGVLVVKTKE